MGGEGEVGSLRNQMFTILLRVGSCGIRFVVALVSVVLLLLQETGAGIK